MKIKIGIAAAVFFLSLIISPSLFSIAAIISAFFHELGHIFAARLLGIELRELRLGIFGARITPKGEITSYGKETILCFAGPAVNILTFLFFSFISYKDNSFFQALALSSLSLGALNLLPIKSFDGGRILEATLLRFLPLSVASAIVDTLSFILIFALWSLSVYLLLRLSLSLSLFIFSCSLFLKLFMSDHG